MRSALGIEVRTGRIVRALEDGRTEVIPAEAVTESPDTVALASADGLDGTAWRAWAKTRFGFDALEVTEEVARTYAEDIAAGAALWALERQRKSGAAVIVPPVAPGSGEPAADPSTMSDFGGGRSMSDFGDGNTMADFKDPAEMSDFGDGRSMDEFGDGRRMSDHEPIPEPPARRITKTRAAVAAAAAVAVIAVTAVVVAAANSDEPPEVPVAVTAPTTEPEPTTTTTVPAERTFDVSFTITSTNADEFPDAPLKTGLTGSALVKLDCADGTCSFEFDPVEAMFAPKLAGVVLADGALSGTEQSLSPSQGLHGDCDRQRTETVTATLSDGAISGDLSFTADPITCPGPEQNTLHVFTLSFEGTETVAASS
jgi:hypothetical protein